VRGRERARPILHRGHSFGVGRRKTSSSDRGRARTSSQRIPERQRDVEVSVGRSAEREVREPLRVREVVPRRRASEARRKESRLLDRRKPLAHASLSCGPFENYSGNDFLNCPNLILTCSPYATYRPILSELNRTNVVLT
jgi:hypothetical protein